MRYFLPIFLVIGLCAQAFGQRIFEYNVSSFNGAPDPNNPGGVPNSNIGATSAVYYDVVAAAFVDWDTVSTFGSREIRLIGANGGQYGVFSGFSPSGPNRVMSNFSLNSPGRTVGNIAIDPGITLNVMNGLLENVTGGVNSKIETTNGFQFNAGDVSVPIEILNGGSPVFASRGIGTNRISGTITNNQTAFTSFSAASANRNATLSGNIVGSAGITINSTVDQTVFLDYDGTMGYAGATRIAAAAAVTVQVNFSNVLPMATELQFGDPDNAARGGILNLNNRNLTVGNLLSQNGATGSIQNNNASAGLSTLTVGGSSSGTFGLQILDGAGLGTVGFTRSGSGTTTLTAGNAYTGATLVTGTSLLLVNGAQTSATGAVTVDADATLGGSGTVGGATSVAGRLAAGSTLDSIGALTFSDSLTMVDGSEISFQLLNDSEAGVSYDQWIGSNLFLPGAGTVTLRITGLTGYEINAGDSFTLFTGTVHNFGTANVQLINETSWAGGWQLSEGSLVLTAIPEPSTALLVAIGFGALLLRRKFAG